MSMTGNFNGPGPYVVDIAPVSGAWVYSDHYVDSVVTGLALPTSGGLSNTVTAGVAYITGSRIAFVGQAVTLTASSDNYIDAKSDGTLQVSAVAISAGAPAVAVNGLRLGYVRTGASTVSSTVTTGKDSLGNWMSNRLPSPSCRLRATPVTTLNGILSFGAGTEVLDNNAMHSTSTNSSRITCVRPGTYNVFGAVNWAAGSNLPDLTIYKNGADANLFAQTYNTASTVISARAGGDIELAAGDYIELRLGAAVFVYAAYLNVRRVV